MKKILYFIMIILLVIGCKKKDNDNGTAGKLVLNMTYNCAGKKKSFEKRNMSTKEKSDTLYAQFGDYITSITPTSFIGKFADMRLISCDDAGPSDEDFGIQIIESNLNLASPARLAYFSNNAMVTFNPDLTKIPTDNDITFNIFFFMTKYYYQEFELPAQYDGIADGVMSLNYFCSSGSGELNFDGHGIGGERTGRIIKGSSNPLIAPIFDSTWTGLDWNFSKIPDIYVFGNTDSSYIFIGDGQSSINNPTAQYGNIVRSYAYNAITLPAIPYGETKTVNGTMTFDISNLIQIYAGIDNIPYTSDDIFVFAPNFWERLSINIIAN